LANKFMHSPANQCCNEIDVTHIVVTRTGLEAVEGTTWVSTSTFDIESHMQRLADDGALVEIESVLDGAVSPEAPEDADAVIARLRANFC
jgi:hypothetical protein